MAKECGKSLGLENLENQINTEMDSAKSSFTEAAGGVADAISGLKDKIKGATDTLVQKINDGIPEIPKPELKLQDEMNTFVAGLGAGDPGTVLDKLNSMKEKFPSVDVDSMLSDIGIDTEKLNIEGKKFNKFKLDAATTARITGQNAASGKLNQLDGAGAKLLALGSGDLSVVADLMGKLPEMTLPGTSLKDISDKICTQVPNVEIDANGNETKKGPESKVSSEDSEPMDEPSKKKESNPPKDSKNNEKVKEAENIVITLASEERKKINAEAKKRFKEESTPYVVEYREVAEKFNKSRLFGGQKNKDRLRTIALLDTIKVIKADVRHERHKKLKAAGFLPISGDKFARPEKFILEDKIAMAQQPDLIAVIKSLKNVLIIDKRGKGG